MITESGIVISTVPGFARVRTTRTSSCEHCAAKSNCKSLGGGKEIEVDAINDPGARTGDRVVLSFHTGSMLKLSFLLYIFPVIVMIAGAIAGDHYGPRYGMDPTNAAVIACVAGFLVAFLSIRLVGNRIGDDAKYHPRIIRISRMPPGGFPPACDAPEESGESIAAEKTAAEKTG